MYKLTSCDWQHDKKNISKFNEMFNCIKIGGEKNVGLRGFENNERMYALALALAVVNYNSSDYAYTLAGERNCALVVHNYIWGSELKLYYQNKKGQERERIIECVNCIKYLEVDIIRYTKTGRKIKSWVGEFRRVKE